jgi:CRISPR-associated protein Cmr6
MQELANDGEAGFTHPTINALFGPELDPESGNAPEDAKRGALDFWDVFPSPEKGKLTVEIMTPHYGKYYQGEEAPHDSGAPVPVSFLAVPAKSQFDFHVVCHTSRLPSGLDGQWRALLDRAFQHAFEWMGFGAKTSVGYGAMAIAAVQPPIGSPGQAATGNLGANTTESANSSTTWPSAVLTLNPSTGEVKASFGGKTTVGIKGTEADIFRTSLGEERANKFKKNKELKGIAVMVEQNGNMVQLKGLLMP